MTLSPPAGGPKFLRRLSPAVIHKALVAGTFCLFAILGFWYSMAVPPFEKPDEVYHYAFAQHLAGGNPLPVQTGEISGPWAQEGSQPPAYYWLVGRLISTIDFSDYAEVSRLNPHANVGNPLYPGNKNLMLYSALARPLAGTNLAVHIGRWFSLLLGLLTLWLIYKIGRLVFPRSPLLAWLVLATVALVPQFAFVSSSVSNDSLVVFLATAVIYWLARLLARPDDGSIWWWEWLVLGVLFGCAALSKLQGLGLLALIGVVTIWLAWRRRSARLAVEATVLVLLPAGAIAGWWYLRNYRLYGDWLGVVPLFMATGLRDRPQTWGDFWGEMRGLRYSFWGLFGWFNILMPAWVYRVLDAVSLLALAGLIGAFAAGVLRHRSRPGGGAGGQNRSAGAPRTIVFLLALWAVIVVGTLVASALVVQTSQGRLTFPALSAFGVLLVGGLAFWLRLPRRLAGVAAPSQDRLLPWLSLLPAFLFLCSLYTLAILVPRSYRPDRPVPALPEDVRRIHVRYGDQFALVGVRLPEGRFRGGESAPVTLYWRAEAKPLNDYALFVQLLDASRETIANITSHPGWGRNPTSLWEPGAIYPDSYLLEIPGGVDDEAPMLATLYVGIIDPDSGAPMPAYDENGAETEGMVGAIPLIPSRGGDTGSGMLDPARIVFQDSIHLVGYDFPAVVERSPLTRNGDGTPIVVRLAWEAGGKPTGEYTAFVHLLGPQGEYVTGLDRAPVDRGFSTTYWEEGDRFLSHFTLDLPQDLPPGSYQVWAGLYRADSEGRSRLPVMDADRPARNDMVYIGVVEVR